MGGTASPSAFSAFKLMAISTCRVEEPSTASKPDVAAASAEIRVLQKKGSEFLMQSHQLPDILLDFERGMDHGPIVSSSDEREKGEQILKSLRTQCLPQYL